MLQWGQTQTPINGFIVPPPFPPVYGAFNLTSYLQGASDYEVMCALLSVVKGLYDYVANFDNDIEAELKAYLDKELQDFTQQSNAQQQQFINDYTNKVNQLIKDIADATEGLNTGNKDYTDSQIKQLQVQIDEIKGGMASTLFYNPMRGYVTTLQVLIDDLVNWAFSGGLTVAQYQEKGWTVSDYDELGWNVKQYADNSAILTGTSNITVLAPWDGNKPINLQEAINYLYNLHVS